MPKRKYYCFDCRVVKRRIYTGGRPDLEFSDPSKICQVCENIMVEGYNYPTPKRSDSKAWLELRKKVNSQFHHKYANNKNAGYK